MPLEVFPSFWSQVAKMRRACRFLRREDAKLSIARAPSQEISAFGGMFLVLPRLIVSLLRKLINVKCKVL
ncbi:hypothetical protein [Microcoleus sp. F4-D5]|uniref:hypothetical protein n=1 Tax=Microcoleus sp. F4-D5 TaxID=2818760 RepID=UPI002FD29144